MEQIWCIVERITFQEEERGFSVLRCRLKGQENLITVVGNLSNVNVGSVLKITGSWQMNPKFGRQFQIESYEEMLPATVYGIEKYLGSGLVKGIGPKYAKRIVQVFGKDTLEIIETEPDRLLEVRGIGKMRINRIKKSWVEQKEIKNIMLFLQGHDVGTGHAVKIFKKYGSESLKVVQDNPYRLADDIWGIGFKTADTIAKKLGFGHERYERLRSGILYTLNELADEGHCFATRDMLLKSGSELLSVKENFLADALNTMIQSNDVVTEKIPDGQAIYLPAFYRSEIGIAKRLTEILNNKDGIRVNIVGLSPLIQRKTGMKYDVVQLDGIITAVTSKVMVLTGGPGTGKTTTTLGIITAFREKGAKVLLAAPTGRAAKRLSEATGMEAKTIHRLLEAKPPEGYNHNEENPLEGDVLILDECSMIDVVLMYNLLKAIPDKMTLIMVGDIDQLPSVGPGNVLRDIIDSDCVPVVRLTKIFRQAQSSRIVMNAHCINQGKKPDISNGKQSDFFFIDVDKLIDTTGIKEEDIPALRAERTSQEILELVGKKLPKYYHIPSNEIQVLTPMQRGNIGASNLNQVLQKVINPGETGLRKRGILFKVKDKVMQIRNNYDKNVFNGDIGIVESVDMEDCKLTVNFDGRNVEYDVSELDELNLAYATTIHKSQGSEYPVVVIPVLMSHYVMLQRNLIYTGITRAKKILVMVGTVKALYHAIRTVVVTKRNTFLKERLRQLKTN